MMANKLSYYKYSGLAVKNPFSLRGCIVLLLFLNVSACSFLPSKPLGRRAYVQWLNNPKNGLCISKKVGDIKFTLCFRPLDYIALNEIMTSAVSEAAFDTIKKKYGDLQYYELTLDPASGGDNILKRNTNSASDYYSNLDYYSFNMKEDLKLMDGDSTLSCVLFNFDNSHDLSKQSTSVFAFEKPFGNKVNDKVIQYNATRFGLGFIKIGINASDIRHTPPLNLAEL